MKPVRVAPVAKSERVRKLKHVRRMKEDIRKRSPFLREWVDAGCGPLTTLVRSGVTTDACCAP